MTQGHRGIVARTFASMMLAVFVFYGVFFGVVAAVHATATAPANIVNYQGRLLNTTGVPVSDATASISFAFYTASSGGTCLWSNSSASCASVTARTVTLTDGLFTENLGDTAAATPYAAIGDAVFFDNVAVYLEVIVNTETLTPRKRLLAAPYAINASAIDGFSSTQAGGTSALALVLDTTGNLQLTGSPQGTGISQGSLYINPATGVVAANEILFGVAVNGASRFSVDGEGDTSVIGDFSVGTASIIAPFSVDESANTVRIGDGVNDAFDPTLTFYASDSTDTGSLSYTDEDIFNFSGGNMSFTGLGTLPSIASNTLTELSAVSNYSGTSGSTLDTIQMYGVGSSTTYSAIENATNTDHYVGASNNLLTISGSTATITRGYGSRNRLTNSSTNASLLQAFGYLTAVEAEYSQSATGTTVATAYGVHGTVSSAAGTITSGSAIIGEVTTSAGTITTGYAGRFIAVSAGTNRYGLFADASGGTANYSGYFTGSQLQVDADSTADTPTYANASGELYVSGDIENRGNVSFGDTTGTDQFLFTSAVTTTDAITVATASLTSGTAMSISRASGGSDVDGTMFAVSQLNTSATSDATALKVTNSGAGNSVGLLIIQNTVSAHVANSTGNNALVIDVNEDASAENVIIMRSDADNSNGVRDTEFRVQNNGELFADGAAYTSGADYAEFFKTTDGGLGDYQLVCQDAGVAEAVRRCNVGDTRYVMGVVSTNAAFVGNNFRGAGYNLSDDPQYRKIGMVGQIDTLVNAGEGAIAIGDAITTSATMTGYGAKSHGPARIVGFALEPLASGTGTVRVLVQPQWYGGDVLTSDGTSIVTGANVIAAPLRTATASQSGDSHDIVLRGSGWSGSAAVTKNMTLRNDVTDGSSDYRLSVVNDAGSQVASIGNTGDLAIAGKLYPSDRGTLQTSKYIYYDGSTGAGGNFMRTNAGGWSSGSYDFAEMFPSADLLAAGEVVVFADTKESIRRSTGTSYDDRIAGVVSTRPGFLAGDNKPGDVPVALSGRVPTYVSGENGAIAVGDPLTTSTKAGYAMKATEPGPIVGYAMDAFSGATGVVVAFIRPSYFDGTAVDAPIAENDISTLSNVAQLDVSGSMNMNGGSIISVASLTGIGNNWHMAENGDFVTRGSIVALITSFGGDDVETYAALGREHTVQLSGTVTLRDGFAKIEFEKVDPAFNDVIANQAPYRVLVTPAGMTGAVYATDRTNEGFTIRDTENTNGVAVDWLVIAYHKDFAPEVIVEDVLADEEAASSEEQGASPEPEVTSIENEDIEAPVAEETVEPVVDQVIVEMPADVVEEVPVTDEVTDSAPVEEVPISEAPATITEPTTL